MKILIEYESSWRNSFLDGSNDEELPKNGRKFIASGTNLNDRSHPENFINREITLNTIMGVMNRLIGDQRKLYQSRQDKSYYFSQIEPIVTFEDISIATSEMTYIRNITGSNDQNSFAGMIKTNDLIFQSDYSREFWGVLALELDDLTFYIVNNNGVEALIELDPIAVCARFDELKKIKPVENQGMVKLAVEVLCNHFPGTNYLNNKGEVVPSNVYCSALYMQLERLSARFNMETAITKSGTICGISKRIFTKKDFMNRFTTGEKKKIWGNPYMRKERIKGVGEVVSLMTKASGKLEIYIDVDRDKAKEIKRLIENAGVSSFYLGKKGLAYVTDIDTRELRD
ncbi:MAG: type I-Fv CRISPR-associated protein Cas5fv [Desulfobacterales bacterium]